MALHEHISIRIVLSAGAERYVLAARFAVAVKDTAERGVARADRELPTAPANESAVKLLATPLQGG